MESLRKKPGKREAFVAVDDMKTPSTSEIAAPEGSRKRTGWASEASVEKKAQITAVLSTTSFPEVSEPAAVSYSSMKSLKDKKKGKRGKNIPASDGTSLKMVSIKSKNRFVRRLF